nr:hypothetical protein [Tanacetum cinerariifolium]
MAAISNVPQDFQENSNDEADERTGKNHARNGEWIDITKKKASSDLESSKESGLELQTLLLPLKKLQGASSSSEVMTLTYQDHSPRERSGLGIMKHTKPETLKSSNKNVSRRVTVSNPKLVTSSVPTKVKTDDQEILYYVKCKREYHKTSNHDMYIASLRSSQNYKAQPYQYASHSKQILKSKTKPYPPCTHYGFNDHYPDDCRNYSECEMCGSYDHFTSEHNRVTQIRGGVLAESSQSSESSIGVSCTTCGSSVHSTTDHNDFEHFKRGEKLQATKAKEPTKKWVHKRN